jgi:DNA-binding NtrC family response regulator
MFREGLLCRLNVIAHTIPPLRERPEDILPLPMVYLTVLPRSGKAVAGHADDL